MSKLKNYSVKDIDSIIRKHKTIKEAAKELNVTPQDIYQFRSKHAKEFSRLKAQYEQGLIVDDQPVVKTKPKTASQIPAKQSDDVHEELKSLKSECEQLKEQVKVLDEANEKYREDDINLRQIIKQRNDKITKHEETIERLKIQKQDAIRKQQETTALLNERTREADSKVEKAESLMNKANKEITDLKARLDAELNKATEVMKKFNAYKDGVEKLVEEKREIESHHADQILKYESDIKELQERLNKQTAPVVEHDIVNKDLNDDVNNPSHYNFGPIKIVDYIEMVLEHYRGPEAGHIYNVTKYVARAPHKGSMLKDLKKAYWHLGRVIEIVESREDK